MGEPLIVGKNSRNTIEESIAQETSQTGERKLVEKKWGGVFGGVEAKKETPDRKTGKKRRGDGVSS